MLPRLSLFYFVYYAAVAVQMAFLPSFLLARGLNTAQLGQAQLIHSTLSAGFALVWARAADRASDPSFVLRLTTAVAAVWGTGMVFAPSAAWLMIMWSTLGVIGLGIIPIVDGITVNQTAGNARWPYGRIRVWGSVGYIVVGQSLGFWLSARGDRADDLLVPLSLVACSSTFAVLAWSLRTTPRREKSRASYRELFASPALRWLVLVGSMHWMSNGVYHVYFGAFVRERGGASWVTATALVVGVLAEIVVFSFAPRIERMFTVRQALCISFLATAVRWVMTPLMPSVLGIALVQSLHGLSFGLFWVTAVRALYFWVPPHLRTQGQGAFAALVFGLSNGVGAFIWGHMQHSTGSYFPVFMTAACFELVAALLLISPRLAMTKTG
jgi:PPP family 3-phenylpropionic acid transporter